MTYPLTFRKKVFEIQKKHNLTYNQVSKRFEISMRTLFRWSKKIDPETTRRPYVQKIDPEALKEDVSKYPDDFQHERAERLGVSKSGICSAMKRLKITRKKNKINTQKPMKKLEKNSKEK